MCGEGARECLRLLPASLLETLQVLLSSVYLKKPFAKTQQWRRCEGTDGHLAKAQFCSKSQLRIPGSTKANMLTCRRNGQSSPVCVFVLGKKIFNLGGSNSSLLSLILLYL